MNQLNVKQCVNCINKNRDMIVGVKIRLSKDVANDGIYEEEAYRYAIITQHFITAFEIPPKGNNIIVDCFLTVFLVPCFQGLKIS